LNPNDLLVIDAFVRALESHIGIARRVGVAAARQMKACYPGPRRNLGRKKPQHRRVENSRIIRLHTMRGANHQHAST
jgi:hypothetical protein